MVDKKDGMKWGGSMGGNWGSLRII